jgi:hypothetical protein
MMKLLLAFASAGLLLFFLLLCATYSTLVYYRLVRIAKGIEPHGLIRSRNFFQPKTELFDLEVLERFAFGVD